MSLLQSMNIKCELKNGISNQVTPMYTLSDGGAKLQVNEEDFDVAFGILKEGGFINDEPIKESSFMNLFDQLSSQIPCFKTISLFLRFAIFVILIVTLLVGMMYLAIR